MQSMESRTWTGEHETTGDARAVLAAQAWIGTPYVLGAALRGKGCDCVGLVRGVWADVTGNPVPAVPPWRADWVNSKARVLVDAARKYLEPVPMDQAAPGTVLVLRMQNREAHCGILDFNGRFIHAVENVGVRSVPSKAFIPQIAFAANFPITSREA